MLIVYSKNNCPKCLEALSILNKKGLAYVVVKVDEVPEALDFLKSEGHKSVPQIYEGDKLFVEGGVAGLKALG